MPSTFVDAAAEPVASPGDPARISAVINTLDAERTLGLALRSIRPWVDEIVVVDMHSTDRTVAIAESFDAVVFQHDRLGYADPARLFAVEQAHNEWILWIDADELVPFELSRRILETARTDSIDVLVIPRKNFIMGAPLTHTGWGPEQDVHPRFFRRGALRLGVGVHEPSRPVPGSRVETVDYADGLAIVHFNYAGTTDFVARLNRYTSLEATQRPRSKAGLVRATWAAVREFLRRFVVKRGYRDGWRGYYLSAFMGFYELATHAKQMEATIVGSEDDIRRSYELEAERLLSEYPEESARS